MGDRHLLTAWWEKKLLLLDLDSGCWVWQGPLHSAGYGVSAGARVHRTVWEWEVGPIPSGRVLDHLCRNRPCCNPEHLEVVTRAENTRRFLQRRWNRLQ